MELKDFIKQSGKGELGFKEFSKEDIASIEALEDINDKVIAVLKLIYDPEISVNIWDLGLIYKVDIKPSCNIDINMTLTSPTCPIADAIPQEVSFRIKQCIPAAKIVVVKLVWDPKWDKSMMSEEAMFMLDL